MLMKKFLGASAREAMQKMKAALGPDALVISNRKTADGVEILAMVEGANPQMHEGGDAASAALSPAPAFPPRTQAAPTVAGQAKRGLAGSSRAGFTSLKDFATRIEAPLARATAGQGVMLAPPRQASWQAARAYDDGGTKKQAWAPARTAYAPAIAPVVPSAALPPDSEAPRPREPSPGEQRVFDELAAMRVMLQNQIASQTWRDTVERRPLAARLWRELVEAGFSATLARTVADKLPDDLNEAQARKWLTEVLSRNIRCADPAHDLVERGGVVALVGPTGVGKTTTTAKLAARCVVKYGAQSLGLVTTDSYRIGAFDQLAIYGKILGVPVHSAQSYGELEAAIATMAGKRLVLIDTTGMGQRDNRVAEQINLLNHARIRRVLLLNAAAQAETLEDVACAYQGRAAGALPLAGAILTKIDEAAKLAPVLDVVARHGLELLHVTNGQRVPEDLYAAAGPALVHRALKAALDPVFAMRDNEVAARAIASLSVQATGGAGLGAFNA